MAYDPLTPENFKKAKPQFANVPDETIQAYIDMAAVFIDKSWPENLYDQAWIAQTCHLMTIDGLGTDAESRSHASGAASYQSIRSGNLSLTRFRAEASSDYASWQNSTACGKYFSILLRMAKGGPRVISISNGCGVSPYAKDSPLGWPGWFY